MLDYGKGDDLYWDASNDEVRFVVAQGDRNLLCRIARDALDEHAGRPGTAEAYVEAARKHFGHITHRISDKLSLGLIEPDGSVLVRRRDW